MNGPGDAADQQDQEVGLVEKPFDQLSDQQIDELGQKALAIRPQDWKHAETDHFILHYRRVTEAKKVARLYPRTHWPLWLNEGLAEYMGAASVAARKNQPIRRHEHTLNFAGMSLDELQEMQVYPQDPVQVAQLYETSEKLIRFIMTELPKERFTQFLDAVLGGETPRDALLSTYPDKLASYDDFLKKYAKFTK
jgi:hypothetical protein